MRDGHEITGFFCRWGLLGLLAAGVVGLWVLFFRGAGVQRGTPTLEMSDGVWGAAGSKYLLGQLKEVDFGRGVPQLMGVMPGGRLHIARNGSSEVLLCIADARPGVNEYHVRGIPYGPACFLERTSRVLMIEPWEKLFIVDARLSLGQGRRELGRLMEELGRRGRVVLISGVGLGEMSRLEEALRSAGMGQAVLLASCRPETNWRAELDYAMEGVSRPAGSIEVITADGELAGAAASRGFRTDLVGVAGWPAAGSSLRPFATLANFQADLAARPISQ